MNNVIACVASQYVRKIGLRAVVHAIAPQVKELHVYLNDYPKDFFEWWMKDFNNVIVHHAELGDLADNGKFILSPADYPQSYFATLDDDLNYPSDYIATMLKYCKTHRMSAVVSLHGCILHDTLGNYYNDRTVYQHNRKVDRIISAHIIGTGCLMFYTDSLQYDNKIFINGERFMTDIIFSALAMTAGLYRIVIPHEDKYLPINMREAVKDSIMLRLRKGSTDILKYISRFVWWK